MTNYFKETVTKTFLLKSLKLELEIQFGYRCTRMIETSNKLKKKLELQFAETYTQFG
jgi:hypothetical protein